MPEATSIVSGPPMLTRFVAAVIFPVCFKTSHVSVWAAAFHTWIVRLTQSVCAVDDSLTDVTGTSNTLRICTVASFKGQGVV